MQTYPSTPYPSFVFTKSTEFKTLISQFENGCEQRRAKWSKGKHHFVINYNTLSPTELGTLFTFYEARMGSQEAFTFVDPTTQTSYTCRFEDDNLSYDAFALNVRRVGIKLVEVF
jgi:uncharacterized protein (TIGR02217 family)